MKKTILSISFLSFVFVAVFFAGGVNVVSAGIQSCSRDLSLDVSRAKNNVKNTYQKAIKKTSDPKKRASYKRQYDQRLAAIKSAEAKGKVFCKKSRDDEYYTGIPYTK